MYPSHCNFTLHEYQFQQYPDLTAEKATVAEKGSAKGKSNTSYLIYLFKLHHFLSTFIYNYTDFMKRFPQIICICINSVHISLKDLTSITDLICVCYFSF